MPVFGASYTIHPKNRSTFCILRPRPPRTQRCPPSSRLRQRAFQNSSDLRIPSGMPQGKLSTVDFWRKYQGWLVVEKNIWKIWKSVGMILPNIWKIKKVPSHQPDGNTKSAIGSWAWGLTTIFFAKHRKCAAISVIARNAPCPCRDFARLQ